MLFPIAAKINAHEKIASRFQLDFLAIYKQKVLIAIFVNAILLIFQKSEVTSFSTSFPGK